MTVAPIISTDRLTLGPLGAEHFERITAFYASERSHFVGGPKDATQSWRQLGCEIGHWTLRGYGLFAVSETATGAFVGIAGPWNPEGWPEAEIAWTLFDGFEGRGYATEAALAARQWCYDTLGWRTAISLVDPANSGSAAVARRLGCVPERMFDMPGHGDVEIWRHPAPASREAAQ